MVSDDGLIDIPLFVRITASAKHIVGGGYEALKEILIAAVDSM
jgi:hypothetical protein